MCICCGEQVFEDPQVLARKMLTEIKHTSGEMIKMVGLPVKFSDTKVTKYCAVFTLSFMECGKLALGNRDDKSLGFFVIILRHFSTFHGKRGCLSFLC